MGSLESVSAPPRGRRATPPASPQPEIREGGPAHPPRALRAARLSLFGRVLLTNALVLGAAAAGLLLTPATVSSPIALQEAIVLVAGLAALGLANLMLLRRAFAPLRRLSALMGEIEYLHTGLRIPVYGNDPEITQLTQAFNDMLDRIEAEREHSWRRAAEVQESERLRVARELHDQVGQSLTALKLLLSQIERAPAAERAAIVAEAEVVTAGAIEEVRDIARHLRPEALDDVGLREALGTLCERTADYGTIDVRASLSRDLPQLEGELELAVYRVAQEALTNVLRHAEASRAEVVLDREGESLSLTVSDDGRGTAGADYGAGIKGMRERALMLGGELEVLPGPAGGTQVSLRLPLVPGARAASEGGRS